jgi:hypothetical protein
MPRARKLPTRPGLKALMGRVNARGMQAVDRRSVAYRAAREWRNEMLASLGGEENLSAQRRTILDLASRTKLFLDHADAYLLSQASLVNKRSKSLIRLIEQRQRLADSFLKHLQALGLDRVPKPVPTMAELLHKRDEANHEAAPAEEEHSR